jgi:ABC-type uncharacterized transport system ATPase subunit
MTPPLLSVRGISKRFGAVAALTDVDLDADAGEIHAILGENGAGKSTLMRALAGITRPDAGTILLDGTVQNFASPRAARHAGIGMVHQHFALVDTLTVAENLALSLPGQSRWALDTPSIARTAAALARRIGLELSAPDTPVSALSVGARQRLEILKALANAGRVLILDEPTAVLTPPEVQRLFEMLRRLRAQRLLVLFITHKLPEVKEIADRVTIMRRGKVITTVAIAGVTVPQMAQLMVGEVPATRERGHERNREANVTLETSHLAVVHRGTRVLDDVSFAVRAGEIFGIAGVDGNGQRELFELLVGLGRPVAGEIRVAGRPLALVHPRAAIAAGIGHIPDDRQREGLVQSMTIEENLLLHRRILDQLKHLGMLRRAVTRGFAARLAHAYAVEAAGLDVPARALSGGNQQRLIVARELAFPPLVLVAVNPMRGLDVAAARAVGNALLHVARQGCAVVLISTDLDEVLDLSDRIGVLYRGRLSAAVSPPFDVKQLSALLAGTT